jgi:flagellar hook-associated protein 2
LFGQGGLVDGSGFAYESARTETQSGSYAVNVTQLAEQAVIAGGAVTAPGEGSPVTIDDSNDEIELTVNGIATGRVTLTQGAYTSGAALAAELQARINGTEAMRDAGVGIAVEFDAATSQFTLRTARYGSEASVEVTFADTATATTFGFSAGQSDTGVDVAGTIGGIEAEGFGRYLTAQSGNPSGLKVEITGSEIGALGQITFSRGVSNLLDRTIETFLRSDGPFSSATRTINGNIEDIGDDRIKLGERLERLEARLVAQFSAMDAMVAQLNQTSNFLSSQLAGLEQLARSGGRRSNDR